VVEAVAEVQAQGIVAVGVVVAVGARLGVGGSVNAMGIVRAGAEAEASAFVTAGKTQVALPGIAAAIAQAQARLQAVATGATSEYLDYAADGVRAIHRRARTAQHFDAFDLLDVQVFQRRATGRGRVN